MILVKKQILFIILACNLLVFFGCVPQKGTLIHDQDVWGKFFDQKEFNKNPILYLGGSAGGIDENVASIYHDLGFPVLSLGYFFPEAQLGKQKDVPDFIPREMERIPLELFGKGIDWLAQKYPNRKITVVASSKGQEGFLAFASTGDPRIQLIDKVYLEAGPGYPLEGSLNINTKQMKKSGHSSWTYQGKEMPYLRFSDVQPDISNGKLELRNFYKHAFEHAQKNNELNAVKFNLKSLSNAKVLFIAGMNDKVIDGIQQVESLLEDYKDSNNIEFLKLEHAGHIVAAAHSDETQPFMIGEIQLLLGDTTEQAAKMARTKIGELLQSH